MRRITSLPEGENPVPVVATIGFFDGVHLGHRCLIDQVKEVAARRGMASAVVTFCQHPRRVMQCSFSPALLTSATEKQELLETTGIDECIMLDFTPQLALLSAGQFMKQLHDRYGVQALVIGYDHRFGHNRSEGFEDYVRYGAQLGMEVIQAQPLTLEGESATASSSRIRQLLLQGDVEQATRLLGYRYFLQGEVESGYQVGRTIGFPTANIRVEEEFKLIPAPGVYAVQVTTLDNGKRFGGMLCIGHRPTLGNGHKLSIEVHLFDYTGNLYHQPLRVEFVRFTRNEQRFNSLEQLRQRISLDEKEIRTLLKNNE